MFGTRVNGTWNGMVGILNRNEAYIGVANFFVTLMRKDVLDYSTPYDESVRPDCSTPLMWRCCRLQRPSNVEGEADFITPILWR